MYDVLYKTMIGAKPLDIMSDKVNGFITDYDEVKYLILFVLGKYDAFFDRIIYKNKTKKSVFFLIIMSKLTLIMIFFQKKMTKQNVAIRIKSAFNKNSHQYYYKRFQKNGATNQLKIIVIFLKE